MTDEITVITDATREPWYVLMVEDCKAIITEAVFNSRWALVEGYHQLGERIVTENNLSFYSRGKQKILQDLATLIRVSERTLYYAVQFYEKYPDLGTVPEGKNISWNKIVTKYLPERSETDAPELPDGKYQVIYADPPWEYDNSGFIESAANQYPTMPIESICDLPVKNMTNGASVLFLWATNPLLPEAMQVIAAWGFEYKTNMAWVKDRSRGKGWFLRSKHELLIIATQLETLHPEYRPDSCFEADRGSVHSRKPEIAYEIIEKMYTGPKIELFARSKRAGWASWGNEII